MEAPLSPPLKPPERQDQRRHTSAGWPGIPLGRLFGLDIRIDISWLIIFSLVVLSMYGSYARGFPDLSPGVAWAAALATTLLFFVCLLLHEVSHSVVARRKGVDVAGITLFMFGGVSQIRQEPRRPSDEFTIAVVGPVTSAVLGLFFLGLRRVFSPDPWPTMPRDGWVGSTSPWPSSTCCRDFRSTAGGCSARRCGARPRISGKPRASRRRWAPSSRSGWSGGASSKCCGTAASSTDSGSG